MLDLWAWQGVVRLHPQPLAQSGERGVSPQRRGESESQPPIIAIAASHFVHYNNQFERSQEHVVKNHTRRIHWWLSAIVVMLVVTGCGRNESKPSARNGQNTITTPTLDIAATHDHQTMVVEGATANALDLVYNQRISLSHNSLDTY